MGFTLWNGKAIAAAVLYVHLSQVAAASASERKVLPLLHEQKCTKTGPDDKGPSEA
jgi:hypothetical protein